MRNFLSALLIVTLYCSTARAEASIPPVLSWGNMNAYEFGCLVEKVSGERDSEFNCKNAHKSFGDVCNRYYDAPFSGENGLPKNFVNMISKDLETIVFIDWNGGNMTAVDLNFKSPRKSLKEVESILGIISPDSAENHYPTVNFGDDEHRVVAVTYRDFLCFTDACGDGSGN